MPKSLVERQLSRGARALLLPLAVVATCTACLRSLPEWSPMNHVSTAAGHSWKPRPDQVPAWLPAKELPGIPPALKPFASELTLSQLVDVALRNSPTTQQAWEQARAAAAAWAEARGSYYPAISGSLSGQYGRGGQTQGASSFTEGLASSTTTIGEASLTLSYLLLDFGGRNATVERARQALLAANWNHNQAILDLLRNVVQAYHTLLGYKAQTEAATASVAEAQTSLLAAEARLQAGVTTIADVLQARATLQQVRVSLEGARGAVETSRGALATAVGWPANTAFDVAQEPKDPPLDALGQNVEALIEQARRNRPDLAAVRASVLRKEAELRRAESALWPQLVGSAFVEGEIVWGNGAGSNPGYAVGVELQIPIFQGFALENAVRAARANLEAARSALQLQEQAVIGDVWTAYFNFRTAALQLEASEALLASAAQAHQASLARYRAGVADLVELLNAQRMLTGGRAQRIQARTGLYTSYAQLVRAIGAELRVGSPGGGVAPSGEGRNALREKN